jgi:hypothetical protein
MASTTFSGPVTSDNGFIGALTGNVTGNTGTLLVQAKLPTQQLLQLMQRQPQQRLKSLLGT